MCSDCDDGSHCGDDGAHGRVDVGGDDEWTGGVAAMADDLFPKRMRSWARRFIQRWAIWTVIADLLGRPKRNAEIISLAADQRQLELEVLMGRVRGEELERRIQALAERYNALKGEEA